MISGACVIVTSRNDLPDNKEVLGNGLDYKTGFSDVRAVGHCTEEIDRKETDRGVESFLPFSVAFH